ncbi:S-phase kinase-associated protein 1 [Drosophila kikkawai]|uniref:S-phase kinase-associated protein 1 n=1 Tax=Drosophila kikkawai TaxID=30033 RepID=A0A6P4IR17_DROKI|nr:S-phase kinase-associated protein 1 [Drosophila kikkawai]
MPLIKLQSSDGEIFETDAETAKCSNTIKALLEDCGLEAESEENPLIPLPNVNSLILNKVLIWAKHHQADMDSDFDKEEDEVNPFSELSPWDVEFLTIDQGTLFELILAANYLDIRKLLNATCQTVANMIRGHTVEEIRQTFHIPNDFSPSEEDLLPKEEVSLEQEDLVSPDL